MLTSNSVPMLLAYAVSAFPGELLPGPNVSILIKAEPVSAAGKESSHIAYQYLNRIH